MVEPGRHTVRFDEAELHAIQETLMAWVALLKIQTGNRLVALDGQRSADMAAKLSSRIQRHSAGLCECPFSPVLGGTHT